MDLYESHPMFTIANRKKVNDAFHRTGEVKKPLSKDVVAPNLKDIETDTKGQVRYLGIYWTLGKYDTVILFEARTKKWR